MLTEPMRNNYYYGKLLDVGRLQLEQDYGKQKRWLLNRLTLGCGVLCGLEVYVIDDKLRVGAGVALDPLGREIVVPGSFMVDPFAPALACHGPGIDPDQPGPITLWLCYRECLTDYAATPVSSCHGQERCEAGTVVESFSLHLAAGVPERPVSNLCDLLYTELTKSGDKAVDAARPLCELVPSSCPEPPSDDCVALATVGVLEGHHLGEVDECAVRTRIYSQPVLVELITCLMSKVAECCHQPTLRVDTVTVFTAEGQNRPLVEPRTPVVIPSGLHGQGFQTQLSRNVAAASVTTMDANTAPDQATVLIVRRELEGPGRPIPGLVSLPAPDLLRWELPDGAFDAGATYDVTLFGDPTGGRPTIVAEDDAQRLDGDPVALPSGDGAEGGDFTFVITCEVRPVGGLKVALVQMATSTPPAPALQDPAVPISVSVAAKPTGFQVTFTEDVDQSTVTAFRGVAQAEASLLVRWLGDGKLQAVDGALEWQTARRLRWRINQDIMSPGHYEVVLFGDTTGARLAIVGAAGARLDGEPLGLPSGDGTQGGVFSFSIDVEAERPLKVAAVKMVMTKGDGPSLADPRKGLVVASIGEVHPNGFRVTFTQDVDRDTLLTWPDVEARNATILVARRGAGFQGALPGRLTWESPRVVVWAISDPDILPPATYDVTLFGDPAGDHRAIAGPDGHRLDGEPAAFPSGDGSEGGNFTFVIAVAIT